jgi:transposase
MAGKRYSKEFQDEACQLVARQGYTRKKAATELGISVDRLKYWLAKRGLTQPVAQEDWPDSDDPRMLKARIRELEGRLRQSETEKEILKKATAYFASHSP